METNQELDRLVQKLVDGTINKQELERFYTILNNNSNDPAIKRILAELWWYIKAKTDSDDGDDDGDDDDDRLRALLEKLG